MSTGYPRRISSWSRRGDSAGRHLRRHGVQTGPWRLGDARDRLAERPVVDACTGWRGGGGDVRRPVLRRLCRRGGCWRPAEGWEATEQARGNGRRNRTATWTAARGARGFASVRARGGPVVARAGRGDLPSSARCPGRVQRPGAADGGVVARGRVVSAGG